MYVGRTPQEVEPAASDMSLRTFHASVFNCVVETIIPVLSQEIHAPLKRDPELAHQLALGIARCFGGFSNRQWWIVH